MFIFFKVFCINKKTKVTTFSIFVLELSLLTFF